MNFKTRQKMNETPLELENENREILVQSAIELIENYLKENHPYIYRTSTTKEIQEWVERQQ